MSGMDIALLSQCDRVLTNCGRPVMPAGVGWVDMPYGIQYQQFLPGQTLQPGSSPIATTEKVVNTPVPWMLKRIMGYGQPPTNGAVYWHLRLPTSRFLQSRTCAVTPAFNTGSYSLSLGAPIECPPGSKFFVTTDGITNNASEATGLSLLLDGCLRYPVKGNPCGAPAITDSCRVERYTLDPNQNILAPEWRLGNQCYDETPPGYRDEFFQFCTPVPSLVQVPWTGQIVSDVRFPIDPMADFIGRLTFMQKIASITGTITAGQLAVRVRTDTGYELTDGFTLAKPIERSLFPSLPLRAGGYLSIDYMVVDGAGTTNSVYNVQTILAGVKRRRSS